MLSVVIYVLELRTSAHLAAVPIALSLLAAVLVHRRSLAAQVLVRAVWWSNLALGEVVLMASLGTSAVLFGLLALLSGAAILIAGRRMLGEASGDTASLPAALRSALTLLMVFALADAQTFLFFGTVCALDHTEQLHVTLVMLGLGLGYVVGFVGLYRLRVWGALLNAALSGMVLVLLYGSEMVQPREPPYLAVLAVLQLVVTLPVATSALSGRSLPSLPARVRGYGADGVVVALMLWATWRLALCFG